MLMGEGVAQRLGSLDQAANRRRHIRHWVLKSATIHPFREEVAFLIGNISHLGVMGRSAIPLSLRQCVFITLNGHHYMAGEVRWAEGDRFGLQLEDPLFCMPGGQPEPASPQAGLTPRSIRIPVDLAATLVTTAPRLPARIRNISNGGMMIETGTSIGEGERLLVAMKGRLAIAGRVQWSVGGRIGLRFEHELDEDIFAIRIGSNGELSGTFPC
jgi:hypothetical protein